MRRQFGYSGDGTPCRGNTIRAQEEEKKIFATATACQLQEPRTAAKGSMNRKERRDSKHVAVWVRLRRSHELHQSSGCRAQQKQALLKPALAQTEHQSIEARHDQEAARHLLNQSQSRVNSFSPGICPGLRGSNHNPVISYFVGMQGLDRNQQLRALLELQRQRQRPAATANNNVNNNNSSNIRSGSGVSSNNNGSSNGNSSNKHIRS
jgi:hypothetical protein